MLFRLFRFFSMTARVALLVTFITLIYMIFRDSPDPPLVFILAAVYMGVCLVVMATLAGLHALGLNVLRCPHCAARLTHVRFAKGRHWICAQCGIDLSALSPEKEMVEDDTEDGSPGDRFVS